MSRIEAEAREVLLRRRRTLSQSTRRPDPGLEAWEAEDSARSDSVARELADIDAALARIQEGRYGMCQSCGGPMGLQRLRAIPEARYCLSCSGHRPEQ
ncbi:MAG: TraR/DksA C4-type zinc finger protein [Anaeromyxobacter sp.]